jgi:hypothetical protein
MSASERVSTINVANEILAPSNYNIPFIFWNIWLSTTKFLVAWIVNHELCSRVDEINEHTHKSKDGVTEHEEVLH